MQPPDATCGGVCITRFLMLVHPPPQRARGRPVERDLKSMSEAHAVAKSWPAMSIAEAHAHPHRARHAVRDGGAGDPRRADPGLEERAADLARRRSRRRARTASKIFLVHEDERVSFEAFFRAVSAFAHELRAPGRRRRATGSPSSCATCRNGRSPSTPPPSLGAIVTPAERLVDRAGAGVRPRSIPAPRSPSSTPSGWSASTEHLHNCPDLEARLRQPRGRRGRQSADRQAGGRDRRARRLGGPARPAAAATSRSRPRTTRPSSTPPARPESRRARSATQRNINSNIMAAASARPARVPAPRRDARPRPIRTPRSAATLLSVPFFHATGCFAVLNPTLLRRRQARDDAPLGPGARLRADRAREDHDRPAACRPSPGS